MKFNRGFWIALFVLLVWLLLAWFLGSWIGLKPPAVWYLRAGLAFLGIVGFVGYLLLRPKDEDSPVGEAAASASAEIDYRFNEAAKRIQAATGNKHLNSLPAVFLLGDTASAKTTILSQSGIEPELVAGQALQSNMVIPTTSVNLWFSRNTLFIDASGGVTANPEARRKLFQKFLPVQLNSLLASKNPPTRSVLFTVDCDYFLQSGGANAVAAKAREYQSILSELSRELGSSFPVYVLFTKADKIAYFREFVDSFNDAEVADLLGVSLPVPPAGAQGSYAEKQSQRLDNAFQTIYYSLAERRTIYLARERTPANLPNVYEFPREFAKLRPLLVQFLTDLCRPSQLGTSPFLRGFYFTGIRPVVINDVVPASQVPVEEDAGFDSAATRIFSRPARAAPLAEARAAGSRKIPQWVFLRNLFPGVLLADRVGTTAAQSNVKVNFVRRLALASAALLGLVMAGWWTVSFSNNSSLIHEATESARAVPNIPLASGQLASMDSLQRLSKVRETLDRLNEYFRNGPPLTYRAFLYKGNDIRQPLRQTYYALFRRLLLQPTQQTMIEISSNPGDSKDKDVAQYDKVYRALKAYLITTDHHEKTWGDFVPVLVQHWKKSQPVDAEREAQARDNFNFYAAELPDDNPYPRFAVPDKDAVAKARDFLNSYPLEESIYRQMLDSAAGKSKSIVFNRDYPGTAEVVRNSYEVRAWFTKPAYLNFQKELQNRSGKDDDWVLGDVKGVNADRDKIRAALGPRYNNEYIQAWRAFLAATSENVHYNTYLDAASVLEQLGGGQSALMQLFCVASQNTDMKDVAPSFQPVQTIAPPGCTTALIGSTAKPYVSALAGLSVALKSIGPLNRPDPGAILQAKTLVNSALGIENPIELGFASDPSDPKQVVRNRSEELLKDPINGVPSSLDGVAGAQVNAAAAAACAAISPVFRKYPFSSNSPQDASLQEVNDFLNPQTGKLWAFLDADPMKTYIQKSGSGYIAIPGQNLSVTQTYLSFVNRAVALRQALYHGDVAAGPAMTFNIRALPSPDIDHVNLAIDGATLSTDPKSGTAQNFPWPGTQQFSLQATYGREIPLVPQITGLWAAWHALEGKGAQRGPDNSVQWTVSVTGVGPVIVNGHALTVRFGLDPTTAQVLRSAFFAGFGCPSKAVQ